ncbi:sclerostin [Callorhinchus milii]|uniref:sclerostin n=1 Tax=Callorhinchus milii TaxID=7868 RepID=UPI001C3F53A1|nr:sclerostin [Callorhinchus milii]
MGKLDQGSVAVCLWLVMVGGSWGLSEGWGSLKNDATELLPQFTEVLIPEPGNHSLNRAKQSNRRHFQHTDSQGRTEFSCRELRSTRYISDGSCRSLKPVRELICSGQCLPAHLLPNSIGRSRWWSRHRPSDYRCIPAHSRTQRARLRCQNGETRTYKVRVVTGCKCKRYSRQHNLSDAKSFGEKPAKAGRNKKKISRQESGSRDNRHELAGGY